MLTGEGRWELENLLSQANKWTSATLELGLWEQEPDSRALRNEDLKAEDVDILFKCFGDCQKRMG